MQTDSLIPSAIPTDQDFGYQGIWYSLGQKSTWGDKYSGGLGTYTANHLPMAVYAPEVERTYFTYGGRSDHGALGIMVSYFDHACGNVPRPVTVYVDKSVNDPHDNAALQLDGHGTIWIFKSGRGRRRPGLVFRSRRPHDITAFDLAVSREMTYPQVWSGRDGGFFQLFTKYTQGRELYFSQSTDGFTWAPDRKLAGFGGHYQVSGSRPGCVATFFNYHPGGNLDLRTNLYYLQSTDEGRTWTTAAGEPCEIPLATAANKALVFDYQSEGKLMYTSDLNFDAAGNPILLYIVSHSALPGPDSPPRQWTIAHWKGDRWRHSVVTESTHNYDMGSLHVDGRNWSIVGPTEPGPQLYGTGGEMAVWISPDEGVTWSKSQITRGSRFNHSYARRPLHAHDPFFTFWADGHSDLPSESRLYFADSTGSTVCELPYSMPSVSHRVHDITRP